LSGKVAPFFGFANPFSCLWPQLGGRSPKQNILVWVAAAGCAVFRWFLLVATIVVFVPTRVGFIPEAEPRQNSLLTNENINSKKKRMIKRLLVLEINNFAGSPVKTGNLF